MIEDIVFPEKEILEISFLNRDDFYSIILKNTEYLIVGGDKDIKSNLIGIKSSKEVYYLSTDDNKISYISKNIDIFLSELLLFDKYVTEKALELPENPNDMQLFEFAYEFKKEILKLDKNAFLDSNTYWSEIYEEMEYGIL
ncbi:MAG: hypothetical protein J6I55_06440 [Ruminococcus sp.]|nr:hypothetical protein [Ruminococcus sp.]